VEHAEVHPEPHSGENEQNNENRGKDLATRPTGLLLKLRRGLHHGHRQRAKMGPTRHVFLLAALQRYFFYKMANVFFLF
jgi:hypothetical protein